MAKLSMFNFISLDGYFSSTGGSVQWHHHGEDESQFSMEMLELDNILLLGRVTYEMMASFWPTGLGTPTSPAIAHKMNSAEKIVFSNSLQQASWNNTRIMKGDIAEQVREPKKTVI